MPLNICTNVGYLFKRTLNAQTQSVTYLYQGLTWCCNYCRAYCMVDLTLSRAVPCSGRAVKI